MGKKKVVVEPKEVDVTSMTEVNGETVSKKIVRNFYYEFYIGDDMFHASERMANVKDGKLYIDTEYLKTFGLHV